nr:MAG TPA: hypothetical protein [Caudoviricetes sp.]
MWIIQHSFFILQSFIDLLLYLYHIFCVRFYRFL